MTEFWAATTNQGKLREFQTLLDPLQINLKSCRDLPTYNSPEETGSTFIENSRIKAKYMAAMLPDQWVFAEDSGIEVDGLDGSLGIHGI